MLEYGESLYEVKVINSAAFITRRALTYYHNVLEMRLLPGLFLLAAVLSAQTQPGSGGATPAITQSFQNGYNRGTFPLTTPTAIGNVKPLNGASPALVQEFGPQGATSQSAVKAALVKPDPNATVSANDTLQVFSDIYAAYSAIAATAGVPTADTQACPPSSFGVCNYQVFSKNFTLLVYAAPGTQTVTVADPFYTEWNARGGIGSVLGPATASSGAVVSSATTSGTQQTFVGGSIFSFTLGGTAVTYTVSGTIFTAFVNSGNYALVGFPTSAEVTLPSGLHRQTFQAARIEWDPAQTSATVFFPLTNLDILGAAQGLTINAGATVTLTATALDTRNNTITNRAFTWSTANGSVASVTGNGASAAVRGLASGTANIYVSAEGRTSPPFSVTVKGVCCNIGEGAPTQQVTQAFQAAAARNKLMVTLPGASGVTRAGPGYIQTLTASDASGTVYVIAQSDKNTIAYVMTGPLYTAYLALGGFGGVLGYPASDVLPGIAQTFESGAALAGNPAQQIPAAVARRWLLAGGVTGALGNPLAAAGTFVSFNSGPGVSQDFAGGSIFAYTGGTRAGQAFVSTGLILARYLALAGPGGALGAPLADLVNAGTVQSQNFEGGSIDLALGAAAAVEHFNPRKPAVTVQPATVAPGGRVHITISGFAPGGALGVTVTGQQAFTLTPASGSFSWDTVISPNAKPATVAVQARAATGSDSAGASYVIASALALLPKWTAVSGDRQSGVPGAALQVPVIALLADVDGNPVPNVPVTVSASPGAVAQSTGVTGLDGRIAVSLRLPPAAGVAVLSLTAAGQVITFSAVGGASTVSGYPVFPAADSTVLGPGPATFAQQGSLLYTLAALIRYQQNSGSLPSPNGLAAPAALNQYLSAKNGFALSESFSPVTNPWVAAQFAGANASVIVSPASVDLIRDAISSGTPVGVVLNVSLDGKPSGSTTVSAIGAAADGSIVISDPNPAYARATLADYLNGFSAQGRLVTATPGALVRVTTASTAGGFVVAAPVGAAASVRSVAGNCGASIDLPDSATSGVRFIACDESQDSYEAALQPNLGATVVDLAGGAAVSIAPASTGVYRIRRSNGKLQVDPQTLSITAVVDAAVFGSGLSPGGLFTIFGTGLRPEAATTATVTINGQIVSLSASLPFQINAQLPATITPGNAVLQVTNALGTVSRTIMVSGSAPAIFVIGTSSNGGPQGAVVNQDGSINGSGFPAARGQFISIYCTGLGATVVRNGLSLTVAPVTVLVNGISLVPAYAGLAPGFSGLYQVNVQIPGSVSPGLSSSLQLQQAGQSGNTVAFALQ